MSKNNDSETSSAAVRYRFTNDVLAGLIVLAHVSVLGAALFTGVDVPTRLWDVFAVTVLLATTWAFGRETLMAVRTFVKGKQNNQQNDGGGS